MSTSRLHNRHGNYTLVPNGFVCAPVSHEAFRLYVVLLMHAPGNATDGGTVFPDYERLKKITGIKHNKTIANSLRSLEETGWLERRRRFGASTVYTLTSPSRRDVMEGDTVRHGVTSITSPDDVHYVTPSKTNKTKVTKPNKQDPPTEEERPTKRHPSILQSHDDQRVSEYLSLLRPNGEGITGTNAKAIMSRVALEHLPIWVDVLARWATAQWRPTNFEGMFDSYDRAVNAQRVAAERGVPAARNGKPSGDTPESIAFREAMRRAAMGEQ